MVEHLLGQGGAGLAVGHQKAMPLDQGDASARDGLDRPASDVVRDIVRGELDDTEPLRVSDREEARKSGEGLEPRRRAGAEAPRGGLLIRPPGGTILGAWRT